MPRREQALTLRSGAGVNWRPPAARKSVPAFIVKVDSTDDYTDVLIELLGPGGGYVKGDRVEVGARTLAARGR